MKPIDPRKRRREMLLFLAEVERWRRNTWVRIKGHPGEEIDRMPKSSDRIDVDYLMEWMTRS